ncbi:alkaline phosphatase family protein [Candidatus Bipolaricaulota bacterium]|nr:alkaline phosphatase family protein [Candidatus Bipolaricaulota bacterium]
MTGPNNKKTVLIGLDGVPYRLIKDFASNGVMPETKKIIEEGTFEKMKSTIPEISSVSWSSVITGNNPGEHGIFGFTDIIPGTYTVNFPNFKALQTKPFWHKDSNKTYSIINVPFTYPAEELNGYLASGFVAPELEKAVYPEELLPKLEDFNYKVDVDSNMAHKSLDRFMEELFEVLDARVKTYRYLWEESDWDVFTFVITGTDRLMHFLWEAYEDGEHKYHSGFKDFFSKVDEAIGEINSRISEEDLLTIVSDHGFGPVDSSANVNSYLKEGGYLEVDSGEIEKRNLNAIKQDSLAFALDPGRIYLNSKERFPKGSVEEEDRDQVIAELKDFVSEFNLDGKSVLSRIHSREEAYEGEFTERAPDMILQPAEGFSLKSDITKEDIFEEEVFTGDHTYPDAIFISNRELEEPKQEDFSVEDIAETIGLV